LSEQDIHEIRDLIDGRAPVITMTELAQRRHSGPSSGVARLRARRPPVFFFCGGAPARAAALAAILAIAIAQLGGSLARPAASSRHLSQHPRSVHYAMLTAAMVRRVVHASKIALAPAGHVVIHDAETLGGGPDGSGTTDIRFSGPDFSAVYLFPGASRHMERVVDGQIYLFGSGPPGKPTQQWYHSTTETSGGQTAPDPVKLLSSLQPTAGFEVIGQQVINGVPVEHLRATNVADLDTRLLSMDYADQPIVGLDVYMDGNGVIQELDLVCKGPSQPTGTPKTDVISIRFLDIGKAETITAPAHYGNEVTHP
jgi:hypothetical protein